MESIVMVWGSSHTVNPSFEAAVFESSKVWLQFKCGHDIRGWFYDMFC